MGEVSNVWLAGQLSVRYPFFPGAQKPQGPASVQWRVLEPD